MSITNDFAYNLVKKIADFLLIKVLLLLSFYFLIFNSMAASWLVLHDPEKGHSVYILHIIPSLWELQVI